VVAGEPATGDRQAFVNGIFGDIFDVLVASDAPDLKSSIQTTKPTVQNPQKSKAANAKKNTARKNQQPEYEGSNASGVGLPAALPQIPAAPRSPINYSALLAAYRAVVVGGRIDWSKEWIQRLAEYVKSGGTVVLNPSQIKGLPTELVGVRLTGVTAEADNARCLATGEAVQNLNGQLFRYEKLELNGATALIVSDAGDPLVTVNKVGKGAVVFASLADLMGEDERITPFAAHMLAHVFADAAPVKVSGDVEYLINPNTDGWVVTLINNNGVYKPQQGMAQVDRDAVVTATVNLSSHKINTEIDWISEKSIDVRNQQDGSAISITIPPGGISIVELKTQ
jgi:hypothetical protein